jgi:uncharacterized membrane protein
MSGLVMLGFAGIHTAGDVLNKLRSVQEQYLIDLEDVCVIERDKNGKVYIKQAVNLTALGAAAGGIRGALLGALVGMLFLNSLAGMVIGAIIGAGAGALSGSLNDQGTRNDFVKKLGETIPENSSALFVLFKRANQDKVAPDLEPYRPRRPRLLRPSLSDEPGQRLKIELNRAA